MVLLPGCPCCGECLGTCVQISAFGFTGGGECRAFQSTMTYGDDSVGTVNGAAAFPQYRVRSGLGTPPDTHQCGAVFEWYSSWYTGPGAFPDSVTVLAKAVLEALGDEVRLTVTVTPAFGVSSPVRIVYRKYQSGVTLSSISDGLVLTFTEAEISEQSGTVCSGGSWVVRSCRCRPSVYSRYMNNWLWGGANGSWWDVEELGGGQWWWVLVIPAPNGAASIPPEVSSRPRSRRGRSCECDVGGASPSIQSVSSQTLMPSSISPQQDDDGVTVAVVSLDGLCQEPCQGCAALPTEGTFSVTWTFGSRQFLFPLAWNAVLGAWYGSNSQTQFDGRRFVCDCEIFCQGGVWIMRAESFIFEANGAVVADWKTNDPLELREINWVTNPLQCAPRTPETYPAPLNPSLGNAYAPGSVRINSIP
jgi:hypothetical protein